jgi:hypothetical protein
MINLENILLIEDKLWSSLESFRCMEHSEERRYSDVALLGEEWWEITHDNNINYLDRLFKDQNLRRSVR